MNTGENYLWENPPSCIAGFWLEALKPESQNIPTIFALTCKCGSKKGSLIGYPLRDLVDDFSGPENFVGPLAFECSSCGKVTEIIDTDFHGYHGALNKFLGKTTPPATIKGEGPRKKFACPQCSSNQMKVMVGFYYSGAEQDIEEDEQIGHMEEFFLGFYTQGICANCGEKFNIAEFDHL